MAGFSALSLSLALFREDAYLLAVVAALIMVGGIGYTALLDLARFRRVRRLTVETRLVLLTSVLLWLVGAAVILMLELRNPLTLGAMPTASAVMNAVFLSVSARTAGFAAFNLGDAREPTLLWVGALMFVVCRAPGTADAGPGAGRARAAYHLPTR